MPKYLEIKVDKFTFHVDPTCFFNDEGVWVRVEKNRARMGLSDYLQQRSGDIAFVNVKPVGTRLRLAMSFLRLKRSRWISHYLLPFPERYYW